MVLLTTLGEPIRMCFRHSLLEGAGGCVWLETGGTGASVDAETNSCAIGFCVGKLVYNPRTFRCEIARYLP